MSSPRAGIPGLSRAKDEAVYDITSVAQRYRAAAEKLEAIAARAPQLRLGVIQRRAHDILVEHLEILSQSVGS
jgi:hypothetical protein